MERRVTIKDIARHTGLHHSTVSRALRDDAQVAKATRQLINATARKLGYSPDPMLRALALYRSSLHPVAHKETIAFLWPEQTVAEASDSIYLQRFLRGARARATELGFDLAEFFLREHKPRALDRILRSRGIRGLVLGVFSHPSPPDFAFPIENFASAALGSALQNPPLNRVAHDHYRAMRIALREAAKLGYRRIALAVQDELDTILESRYSMSFLAHHPLGRPAAEGLLFVDPLSDASLGRFLQRVEPELLITTFSYPLDFPSLRRPDGTRFPLVSLDVVPGRGTHAGIDQRSEFNAANAIDLVAEQVLHGRVGIPDVQKKVLTDGIWCPGPSCPAKTKASPASR